MKEHELTQSLNHLKNLKPREEILSAVRSRVFTTIAAREALASMPQPVSSWSFFSLGVYAPMIVAFALVLVVANQLPMQGTYRDSIASVVAASQTSEALEKSQDPIAAAQAVKDATAHARETLDTLKLKGQFATYTQTDCLHAYSLYDSYLDYLGTYLEGQIPEVKDKATRASFEDLLAYVKDSQKEAKARINLYATTMKP